MIPRFGLSLSLSLSLSRLGQIEDIIIFICFKEIRHIYGILFFHLKMLALLKIQKWNNLEKRNGKILS